MRNKILKSISVFAVLLFAFIVVATPTNDVAALDYGVTYADNTDLGNADPRDMITNILAVVMTFLGLIATLIILLGGFKWMTAAGNEDKVDEAKKLLAAGIIGLVILLAAYGIANFVINAGINVAG